MKQLLLYILLTFTLTSEAQHKVDWKDVKVYELSKEQIAKDSVGPAIAEWFTEGEAASLSELSPAEHISIKKKAASFGCNVAYVDVRKVHGPMKGKLYVVGFYKK